MLREWLEDLLTSCPPQMRELGVLREQIAIDARVRRYGQAWAPHIACSRAAVLAAADRCPRQRTAVILGAGLVHDVPLSELHRRFQRVVLVDLFHRTAHVRRVARIAPQAVCRTWDASGALTGLFAAGPGQSEGDAIRLMAAADPGAVPDAVAIDLVVSLNLASQLGMLPAAWLERGRPRSPGFRDRLCAAAAAAHLAWMRRQAGVRLVVTDLRRELREPTGRPVSGDAVGGLDALGEPQRSWDWRIAPAGEHDPRCDLVHRVGAVIWDDRMGPP
jgi:hypothetical protein